MAPPPAGSGPRPPAGPRHGALGASVADARGSRGPGPDISESSLSLLASVELPGGRTWKRTAGGRGARGPGPGGASRPFLSSRPCSPGSLPGPRSVTAAAATPPPLPGHCRPGGRGPAGVGLRARASPRGSRKAPGGLVPDATAGRTSLYASGSEPAWKEQMCLQHVPGPFRMLPLQRGPILQAFTQAPGYGPPLRFEITKGPRYSRPSYGYCPPAPAHWQASLAQGLTARGVCCLVRGSCCRGARGRWARSASARFLRGRWRLGSGPCLQPAGLASRLAAPSCSASPVPWTPGEAITAITSSITDPSLEGARGMGARFPGAHSDSSPDAGDDCQLWYVKTIFKAAFDEMSASYLQESPCNRA